jgi:PiT family inorganic phosphate transporter
VSETLLLLAGLTIVAVVIFDFTNGFHDASNMVATLVASRAMTPGSAALLVGGFTFLGPIIGGTAVADTLGGIVDLGAVPVATALTIIAAAILGAIAWNIVTWRLGLPSSSSHALVGGLVGAVVVGAGGQDLDWGFTALRSGSLVGVTKVLVTLFTSPLIGLTVGFCVQRLIAWLRQGATVEANRTLRRAQWITAAALAFAHGTNDAQKGMAIITLVLLLGGAMDSFAVPTWVIIVSATSITLGTMTGGWRIVRTVGFGIYRLRPLHGFDAQLSSAAVVFGASLFGGPVSTTHVVSSAIMGVGAAERPRSVRWTRAAEIALAWLVTMPGAALLAVAAWGVLRFTL